MHHHVPEPQLDHQSRITTAGSPEPEDHELEYLTAYLLNIAPVEDLSAVVHGAWRRQFEG